MKTYITPLATAITGNFVIEIVNNCPTNSAKKDRVSIWNLSWVTPAATASEESL